MYVLSNEEDVTSNSADTLALNKGVENKL